MTARRLWAIARRVFIWGAVIALIGIGIVTAAQGEWGMTGFFGFAIVGAVILTERPRNGVGRFLFVMALLSGLVAWSTLSGVASASPAWLEGLVVAASFWFWALFWMLGFVFPTGRPQTRLGQVGTLVLTVYGAIATLLGLVSSSPLPTGRPNPFAVPALAEVAAITNWLSFAVLFPVAGLMVVDLVRRWRRADTIERLQYRWFVFGMAAMIVVVALSALLGALGGTQGQRIANIIGSLALNLPPIAIGIAVTRHGLYDIGRVVSRTVAYATVTLVSVGVYALVVTSVALLLPAQSALPVALATLAAAAAFLPALRWVQHRLDRRFDRERYDAEKVVDAFGQDLRDGADPHSVSGDLVTAVGRALQPASMGLWVSRGGS